jgi:hypothetical protein
MLQLDVLTEFKNELISFFDELISQFPFEGELIKIRIFFQDQIPIKDVVDYFVYKILPFRQQIKNRNEGFFVEHPSFFENLDKQKIHHFKRLWLSGQLDEENKLVIWKWIDTFIFLADKYQKFLKEN